MTSRRPNIGNIDAEITALSSKRQALNVLADAAALNDFMIAICEDPAKVAAYKKNPRAFVEQSGLPDHLIELVVSGGRYAFRAGAAGGVSKGDGETVVVVVIIVIVVIL